MAVLHCERHNVQCYCSAIVLDPCFIVYMHAPEDAERFLLKEIVKL